MSMKIGLDESEEDVEEKLLPFWKAVSHNIEENYKENYEIPEDGTFDSSHLVPAQSFDLPILREKLMSENTTEGLSLEHISNFVKSQIPLSVKVIANHISLNRINDDNDNYPLKEFAGKDVCMSGSGWVKGVKRMSNVFACPQCDLTWENVVVSPGLYSCLQCNCGGMPERWRERSETDANVCRVTGQQLNICAICGSEASHEYESFCKTDRYSCNKCPKGKMTSWYVSDKEGTCPLCNKQWWKKDEAGRFCKCPRFDESCDGVGEIMLCKCKEEDSFCQKRDNENKAIDWWTIEVPTAKHLIYDNSEAAKCRLVFFDDGKRRSKELGALKIMKEKNDNSSDFNTLSVVTCDKDFIMNLTELLERQDQMAKVLKKNSRGPSSSSVKPVASDVDDVVLTDSCMRPYYEFAPYILIGHPKGKECHISIGWSKKEIAVETKSGKTKEDHFWGPRLDSSSKQKDEIKILISYSSKSCAGLSGSAGILFGYFNDNLSTAYPGIFQHSGIENKKNLSVSAGLDEYGPWV